MITIAICDDEEKELNITKEMCNKYMQKHAKQEIRVMTFSSSAKLHQRLQQQEQFDLILLDIYMPDMTGIELARSLREHNNDCQIIFLTTSLAHAIEAFSLHAAHYLVKPFVQQQLEDALHKALTLIEKRLRAFITLKTTTGLQKITLSSVLYAETDRHLQHIYLVEGKCIQVRITSAELYDLLASDNRFFKCGSTYIVNLGVIEEISNQRILFESGNQIPMLRRQYKELLDRYTSYALEGNEI